MNAIEAQCQIVEAQTQVVKAAQDAYKAAQQQGQRQPDPMRLKQATLQLQKDVNKLLEIVCQLPGADGDDDDD